MRDLTVYTPETSSLFRVNDEIDRILDSFFEKRDGLNGSWSPVADVIEYNDKYSIRTELPGVKQKDIKITVDDNLLKLEGERKYEKESKDNHARSIERFYGSFTRSFHLPKGIKRDDIAAAYKDGVLEINLPKSEEAKPKHIEISVN